MIIIINIFRDEDFGFWISDACSVCDLSPTLQRKLLPLFSMLDFENERNGEQIIH